MNQASELGVSGIVGFLVVALVMLDFLTTTISLRREGPIAHFVASAVRFLLGRGPGILSFASGPLAMSLIAASWIGGLWIGWTLVFADVTDLLEGPPNSVTGFYDAMGFTGALLSTLGLGVLTPTEAWVHILVVFASISGMIVLTLSVTYVLNVSSVATSSRGLARRLDSLRDACAELDDLDLEADLLLASEASLVGPADTLCESRKSFQLASLYEPKGSELDVHRAALQSGARVRRVAQSRTDPVERLRLTGLADTLDSLRAADE